MQNRPKKSLGQNFLLDKNILNKIVKIGKISDNDHVLEVGPGTGNLTKYIIGANPKSITVVEKDTRLCNFLNKKFNKRIKIVNDDILKIPDKFYDDNFIIFGNLPYNISTQILARWCLNNQFRFKKLILMFQKEVGNRIIADVNTKYYSRITVLANWKFHVRKICEIDQNCFFPKPKVNSMLLEFVPKFSFIKINNPKNLEKITNIFFNQRRKMIKNTLKKVFGEYDFIQKKINLNIKDRPQNITIEKYLLIVKEFEKN
mgnify:FL=1|tara:strand:+ start:11841 stop:12617 length:777 start_codon:yes stop_codon:yes gene_type:complete